jgi:hypothetical protein
MSILEVKCRLQARWEVMLNGKWVERRMTENVWMPWCFPQQN